MKIKVLSVVIILALAFVCNVMATPPGKNIEYEGGWAGKVLYDGTIHGPEKGMKCPDCHPALFPMKKSPAGTFKKTDMIEGKNCGACHNGEKAFATFTPDFSTCAKCHKKGEVPAAPAPAEEKKE
jgi:c(7)-type cytochrome triheme protein